MVQFRFRVVHHKTPILVEVRGFVLISVSWTDLRVGAVLREQNALPYGARIIRRPVGKGRC